MPSQVPIWLGSTAITECPNSPQISFDSNRLMVTRHYEGPWDAIVSNQPVKGQAWQDMAPAVLITRATLTPKPGGIGHLEVYGETPGVADSAQPTYEVEWVEIDRALILHPRYLTGGAKALSASDQAMLQKWEDEDDPNLKGHFLYKVIVDPSNSGTAGSLAPITSYTAADGTAFASPTSIAGNSYNLFLLSANAQDYAAKRLMGEESYRIWCPVARQTLETFTLPGSDPCGVIENPPGEIGAPSGYLYQRSAQRATKTGRYGKWQQQQEWQGFDFIDTDLYPSGS